MGRLSAIVRVWSTVLYDPLAAFTALKSRSLEQVLGDYLLLLLCSGALGAVFYLLTSVGRAVYYHFVLGAQVEYIRLLNYAGGAAMAIFMLFLFAGTFLLFFIVLVLRLFFRQGSFVEFLRIALYSLSPVLLFGWVLPVVLAMFVWAAVLLVSYRQTFVHMETRRGSLRDR